MSRKANKKRRKSNSQPTEEPKRKQPLTGAKKTIFQFLMFAIPVLLFLLLEFSLGMIQYGGELNLVVPNETDSRYFRLNYEIGKIYFPRQNISTAISYDVFLKEKPENSYRIFVLGGSSAAGYPYMHNGAFSRMLRTRLQAQYPDRLIEVVNAGMPAVNSFTVLDFVKQLVDYQPDAFLLYTGHNEFYGALGAGSTESLGQSRELIKLYLGLQRFRTFHLVRNIVNKIKSIAQSENKSNETKDSTLMERMVGEKEIPLNSPVFLRACEFFQANLTEIIQISQKKNIDLVLGELVANVRDQKPFVSQFENTNIRLEWRQGFENAQNEMKQGKYQTALGNLKQIVQMDNGPAILHYLTAQCYEALGNADSAKTEYYEAKDRDALRFRAPEEFNRILRKLSHKFQVPVVPLISAFEIASPRRLIGDNLMTDHLHPTLDGFFLIAKSYAETMQENHLFSDTWKTSVCPPDSLLKQKMGITPIDLDAANRKIEILKSGWPFQPKGAINTARQVKPQNYREDVVDKWLHHELNWEQAHVQMAEYYTKQKSYDLAADEYFALLVGTPFNEAPYLKLAEIRIMQHHYSEALAVLTQSLQFNETTYANKWIGTILLNQSKAREALPYLEKAVQRNPSDYQTRYNLSGAYYLAGQINNALTTGRELLKVNPDYPGLQEFVKSLEATGRK